MCIGGSTRLAEALIADLREHGGNVLVQAEPRSILVRNGKVAGVELTSGGRIESSVVCSGLNPHQTFLDLIPADAAPARMREQATAFQYNLLAPLFALNVCLSEQPRYPVSSQALMVILGLDDAGQFDEIVAAHERGVIPRTVMWGACPTAFDPSQAPAGRHVAFMWEKLPYALRGDPAHWDSEKQAHGQAMLEFWIQRAPMPSRTGLSAARSTPNAPFLTCAAATF
jgi:phytoene dehydrogenase-like protein